MPTRCRLTDTATEPSALKPMNGAIRWFIVWMIYRCPAGAEPPLVNREHAHDGLTHSSKGRRFKLAVTYGLGG